MLSYLILLFPSFKNGIGFADPRVIPLGFKPKTFRTGICHSISLNIPLFMGIFGIPQKRICADFAPIRLVHTLLSVAKVRFFV